MKVVKMKFQGVRPDGSENQVILDGQFLKPERSQGIVNHSPDGFNWGYGGSGASQLALAILLEFNRVAFAVKNYRNYTKEVISKIPFVDMVNEDIDVWIESE